MKLRNLVLALDVEDMHKPCEVIVVAKCGEPATIKRKENGSFDDFRYHSVFPFYEKHEVVGLLNTEVLTVTIKK